MAMQHIGEWIKHERLKRGWTQEELGERLRITGRYISMLETQKASGDVTDLLFVRICEVLGPIPAELPCANEWQSHFLKEFRSEQRVRQYLEEIEQAIPDSRQTAFDELESKVDKLLADACRNALRPVVMSRRRGCRTYLIQIDQDAREQPLDEEKLLALANVFTILNGVNGDVITVHEVDDAPGTEAFTKRHQGTEQSGTGLQPVNGLQTQDSRLKAYLNHFVTPLGPTDRL